MTGLPPDPLSGRDIAAFVAAFESQSMHAAADALGLTQSAVSKRVQTLERRTGVRLLERNRNGVRPTKAGRVLYPEAKQALAALTRAAAALEAATDTERHVLRLAASHTIGEFLLPNWLAGFRAADRDPSLRAEVDIVNSPGVLGLVRGGSLAIGFVEGPDALDGIEALTLMRDQLVVVVGPDHRWTRRRQVRLRELGNERFYARERDSGTREVVTNALERHGMRLEAALEAASIQALKRAVLADGFTILSTVAVEQEVRTGTLRSLTVQDVSFDRELRVIRSRHDESRSAAQRLWRWLRDYMVPGAHATG